MYEGEYIYIAGPECFYTKGFDILDTMRNRSENVGFGVTLPNDTPLFLENEDLQKNADTIFENCSKSMDKSTVIIADLEFFRGTEPDGGTIFEIGMAYALGIRCYGYTRDKRNMVFKHLNSTLKDGIVYDFEGRVLPYQNLPFSPNIMGSCKIIEGDFYDCLEILKVDIEEEKKKKAIGKIEINTFQKAKEGKSIRPLAYLAGPERFDTDCVEKYMEMKNICQQYGIDAITPMDEIEGVNFEKSDDVYIETYQKFYCNQQHVRDCDLIIGNLNDFHGFEPNSDTSFECGMAYQLNKKLYGYMDDTSIMRKRIPHYGDNKNNKDIFDYDVENFNYPINLMFASSMKIFEGKFEKAIKKIAEDLAENQNRL